MGTVIEFFLKRPLIVNLISIMIIIVGSFSVWNLQKEIFPQVEFEVILINTIYPGASAEDVEQMVTVSIERSLKSVEGIKDLHGISSEGKSIVYIEVDPDYEVQNVFDDAQKAIDAIVDFPNDVEDPYIFNITNKQRGVISIALTGGTYNQLADSAKNLRDVLEENKKVAKVTLGGYQVDEIRVEVNPKKLNSYELTFAEVQKALKDRNLNLAAGQIESGNGDILIRTVSEFEGIDDVKSVVVRSNTTGVMVRIKDIANVKRVPTKNSIIQRSQGKEAIFLGIFTKETADVLESVEEVRTATDDFFKTNPYKDVKFEYTDDMSFYVKRRLNILKNSGLLGLLLVFTSLLLFLNFQTSVVTSLGAPIAFMAAFIFMSYYDISLNMISMFSLILVLGMLVDDAIIVAEQFYQKIEKGMEPYRAAKEASLETIKPVTATIATTIIAFGALFFMGGIMGKFIWPVPAVVIICLLASLFECFFILPSHLAEFVKSGGQNRKFSLLKLINKKRPDGLRWYDGWIKFYGKSLKFFLKHPFKVWLTFLLFFVFSIYIATTMRIELFPGDDVRIVYLQLKGENGIPLSVTDQATKKVEKIVLNYLKKEEYEQVRATVGSLVGMHEQKIGSHYASLIMYLTPPDDRERSTDQILSDLSSMVKKEVPNFTVTLKRIQGGPPKGNPLEVELVGKHLDSLKVAAAEILKVVSVEPGVTSSEIDFEDGKQQIVIDILEGEAKRLGLSTSTIALELRRILSGDEITKIREVDEDIKIRMYLDSESIKNENIFSEIYILNDQRRRIPLSKVIKIEKKPGAFVIRRLNHKRIISVIGTIDKEKTTPLKISNLLRPKVKKIINGYPDVTFKFGGERGDLVDSMSGLLKSAIIALFCIFLVLVLMFNSLAQPIVVMMAIPLGMMGVIWIFKLRSIPLGFMALMGVVALIGVVVNDSIVMVSFINKKRDELGSVVEAIYQASVARFRPIILTTLTTVAGLMPLAETKSDPFIRPMALSFAWGLLIATVVTLVFIPCNYLLYVKASVYFRKKIKLFKSRNRGQNSSTTRA